MVTLAYENEDVASLPSFEKKGEFCEAVKLSFAQHSLFAEETSTCMRGTHAPRFNLLDGIELNDHPSFVEMDLLRNMELYLHACLGCTC